MDIEAVIDSLPIWNAEQQKIFSEFDASFLLKEKNYKNFLEMVKSIEKLINDIYSTSINSNMEGSDIGSIELAYSEYLDYFSKLMYIYDNSKGMDKMKSLYHRFKMQSLQKYFFKNGQIS